MEVVVWTKQNEAVLQELAQTGRLIARKEYIQRDLEEHASLVLEVYDWLAQNSPITAIKPADVTYPIWVSTKRGTTMLPNPGTVIIELAVDRTAMASVNINKWGTILNYSYIAADPTDEKRHRELLKAYGVSDTQAYMSQFYPQIKREIIASWSRLFDPSVDLGNQNSYGIIWEVKQQWIRQIIR